MRPAIFLDRDGVIIENRDDYVRKWEDVEFIPAALDALRALAPLEPAVVIVTNQAVVGKGIITLDEAEAINQRIITTVRQHGGRIDAAYICPHRPAEHCNCRKPKPGMLLRAAAEHGLSLANAIMVGDAITDMQAARAAGADAVLVKTGRGERELAAFGNQDERLWFRVSNDLLDAIALTPFIQIATPISGAS